MSKIVVDPSYLYAMRMQSHLNWKSMICEMIDNSFGAGATEVRCRWKRNSVFEIEDNGKGMSDFTSAFLLGSQRDREDHDIGKYGTGLKSALIWLWGTAEIESHCNGVLRRLRVDWEDVAKERQEYPSNEAVEIVGPTDRQGTLIRVHWKNRKSPDRINLSASIAATYSPGIEQGLFISCEFAPYSGLAERLKPRKWPKCQREETKGIFAGGRSVKVRMGIVADGEINTYNKGFSFERASRVIKESTLGANGFSVARIACRVTLGSDWVLSTFKDDFEDHQDELGEAINAAFHEMMEEASQQAMTIEDSEFLRGVEDLLNDNAATRREKRPNKGDAIGTVSPKESGVKRRKAAVSSDEIGSVDGESKKGKGKGGKYIVDTYEGDNVAVGYYDKDGNRVLLNKNNPWVSELLKNREQGAFLLLVYTILCFYDTQNQGKARPLFRDEIDGDFLHSLGRRMELIAEKTNALPT